MTIQITEETTSEIIRESQGFVTAGKLYPKGVTTNSYNGVSNLLDLESILSVMEEVGMVLCVHAQDPFAFISGS